jgi:iron uptake system component EfeO
MKAWMTWTVGIAMTPAMAACSSSSGSTSAPTTDAEFQASVTQGMHDSLQKDLNDLVTAAKALQTAAPDHPWDQTDPAVPAMETAWIDARHAYEHVEGATAPVFPMIDTSIDGRVEDFGPAAGTGALMATSDMFGDQGMTGLHAVERILYTSVTPAAVVTYETDLGYVPPQAYPTTQQDADDFKNKLCAKIITDATALLDGWTPSMIDIGSAFSGLTSLMNEQKEKVTKAGLDQEESRYSQRTMDDLRQNLAGTTSIYAVFSPWIKSKAGGSDVDAKVNASFKDLRTIYNNPQYAGDAFPKPPADWSDVTPSASDLMTPFGQLYTAVDSAVDATKPDSAVSEMNDAAALCGLPAFSE